MGKIGALLAQFAVAVTSRARLGGLSADREQHAVAGWA
jgi:hypothetical protein